MSGSCGHGVGGAGLHSGALPSFGWRPALWGSALQAHTPPPPLRPCSLSAPLVRTLPVAFRNTPNDPGSYGLTTPDSITSANDSSKSVTTGSRNEDARFGGGRGWGWGTFQPPIHRKQKSSQVPASLPPTQTAGSPSTHTETTSSGNYFPRARLCSQCWGYGSEENREQSLVFVELTRAHNLRVTDTKGNRARRGIQGYVSSRWSGLSS